MEEVFTGLTLELVIANLTYEVRRAMMNPQHQYIFTLETDADLPDATEGELIISDHYNLYAIMKVRVCEHHPEQGQITLICETVPDSFNFFQRSFIRLKTDYPVTYLLFQPGEREELLPVTTVQNGRLKDLNLCGACLEIGTQNLSGLLKDYNYNRSPLLLRLSFQIPFDDKTEEELELLSKVVNVKKSWKGYQLGVLFLTRTYQQYSALERFYSESLQKLKLREEEKLLHNTNIIDLIKSKF